MTNEAATPWLSSQAPVVIGARNTTVAEGYAGEVAEIIVYEERLPEQKRKALENYLSLKWFGRLLYPVGSGSRLTVR